MGNLLQRPLRTLKSNLSIECMPLYWVHPTVRLSTNSCYGVSPRGRSDFLPESKLSSGGVDDLQRELHDHHRRHRQLQGTRRPIAFGFSSHPYIDQRQVEGYITDPPDPGMLSLPVQHLGCFNCVLCSCVQLCTVVGSHRLAVAQCPRAPKGSALGHIY